MAASFAKYNTLQWANRSKLQHRKDIAKFQIQHTQKKPNSAVANIGRDTLQLVAIMMRTQIK